ncbi:hypothetical protein HYU50_04710 [Candidatus Woesearchaeota archaeon]|nr:hypothetical protein [Candidatus Woesearchaeota archaeon]
MKSSVLDEETRKIFTYDDELERWDRLWRKIDGLINFGVPNVPSLDDLLLSPKTDINEINGQLDAVEYLIRNPDFLKQFKRIDEDTHAAIGGFFFSESPRLVRKGWENYLANSPKDKQLAELLRYLERETKDHWEQAIEGIKNAIGFFNLAQKLPRKLEIKKHTPKKIESICAEYDKLISSPQVTEALDYASRAVGHFETIQQKYSSDKQKEKYAHVIDLRRKKVDNPNLRLKDYDKHIEKLRRSQERSRDYEIRLVKRLISELGDLIKTEDANRNLEILTGMKKQWNLTELFTYMELAAVAYRNNWTRPEIAPREENCLIIRNGVFYPRQRRRHDYTPNDTYLNLYLANTHRVEILEGVNMGGKTMDMKKALYIATLALSGSFVPATYACVSARDRIILRGKGDGQDRSAFVQDVARVNEIVPPAGQYWLAALDEPFTSTEADGGMYLTAGVAITVAGQGNSLLILSSHYPSLKELLDGDSTVKFNHFPFTMEGKKVTFPHKKQEGGLKDYAYAIAVARSRGFDETTLQYASEYLQNQKK